jgi:hypothetical protein
MCKNICNVCNKQFNSSRGLANHLRGGCTTLKHEGYNKPCPICNVVIQYESRIKYEEALKLDSRCYRCCSIGRNITDETKLKISKRLKEKYKNGELVANISRAHSHESRIKMGKTKTNVPLSDEHKNKISKSILNSEKHKIAMRCEIRSKKISNYQKNKIVSEETKKIQRLNTINRITSLFGGEFHPSFNKKACKYFDLLMLETNTHIQHALNGGEYYIEELGYWVDGYDKENNIVYEFDEKYHFNKDGNLKLKDIQRQKLITEHLKCKFIRIHYSEFNQNNN